MKHIAILGSGVVGQVLANGFVKHGHSVVIGRREIKPVEGWSGEVKILQDAVKDAEIVVLAVKGLAAEETVKAVSSLLSGKIVIDATNPISTDPPTNGVLHYFTTLEQSLMERLQTLAPDAQFVKAFNSVGNAYMVNPDFGGICPTMFICGNNQEAKQTVTGILTQFGWEAEDMGGVEAARAIEPLCMLWCIPGFTKNKWTHAFKLLKK